MMQAEQQQQQEIPEHAEEQANEGEEEVSVSR